MSYSNYLSSLQEQHTGLETLLDEEMKRPMPDFMKIQRLKKEKLRIRQQIFEAQRHAIQNA